jgi:1-acyl-sn-glycerol-3-phosphate acyltransferase
MIFLRSTLFNILFLLSTGLACVVCLPGLFLPHRQALRIVYLFTGTVYFLERHVLGLDYEVRGREHLPPEGTPFIVAAKHESAYETMKLHIIFRDPAIILKRELLRIPLWGYFLAKSDPIAIDRSKGAAALRQIVEGAKRIGAQGRPLVIFPQGTRVRPHETVAEKPYRAGVARAQQETGMTIVPLALNSGCFWPKGGWLKKPGRVVFEFLPPLPPGGRPSEVMERLEREIESASARLRAEAGAVGKAAGKAS